MIGPEANIDHMQMPPYINEAQGSGQQISGEDNHQYMIDPNHFFEQLIANTSVTDNNGNQINPSEFKIKQGTNGNNIPTIIAVYKNPETDGELTIATPLTPTPVLANPAGPPVEGQQIGKLLLGPRKIYVEESLVIVPHMPDFSPQPSWEEQNIIWADIRGILGGEKNSPQDFNFEARLTPNPEKGIGTNYGTVIASAGDQIEIVMGPNGILSIYAEGTRTVFSPLGGQYSLLGFSIQLDERTKPGDKVEMDLLIIIESGDGKIEFLNPEIYTRALAKSKRSMPFISQAGN